MNAAEDDIALLSRVAAKRDEQAFAELFRRHQHAVFGLAIHITRQRETAEEAAQEALLRVWRAADSFRPQEGSEVRGWILRIVARESLMCLRKRRQKRKEQIVGREAAATELPAPAHEMEREETWAALRNIIAALPDLEQKLIALHFGGGLSHQEIGSLLLIPRSTVSHKIDETLKGLRMRMAQSGFVAVAPLLGAADLHRALTAGVSAPASLQTHVFENLSQSALEPAFSSRRAGIGSAGGRSWLLPTGIFIATTAAGLTWWSVQSRQTPPFRPISQPEEQAMSTPVSPIRPAAKPAPFFRRWDFNTPEQAREFTVIEGSWRYLPDGGEAGSGCMETAGDTFIASFAEHSERFPILISFRSLAVMPQPPDAYLSSAGWGNTALHWAVSFRNLGSPWPQDPRKPTWVEVRVYLTTTSMDLWTNDRRTRLMAYELKTGAKPDLMFRGPHRLDDLTYREISLADLPDVGPYLSVLEKIPLEKRVGKVPLPELKSSHPSNPVYLEFWKPEKMAPYEAEKK